MAKYELRFKTSGPINISDLQNQEFVFGQSELSIFLKSFDGSALYQFSPVIDTTVSEYNTWSSAQINDHIDYEISIIDHNNLNSFQGGTTNQYFHLTSSEYDYLQSLIDATATPTFEYITTGFDSIFGDSSSYLKIESIDIESDIYPMIKGYTDGTYGNSFAIANRLIIYDDENNNRPTLAFVNHNKEEGVSIQLNADTTELIFNASIISDYSGIRDIGNTDYYWRDLYLSRNVILKSNSGDVQVSNVNGSLSVNSAIIVEEVVKTLPGHVSYDSSTGFITQVSKTGGRTIDITTVNGTITSMTDGVRTWTYTYDINGRITGWVVS